MIQIIKEIGSNFWLNKYEKLNRKQISLEYLNINIKDIAYLSTGRSAISFVLNHIGNMYNKKKIALIPSFTCYTVIEPFIKAGYKIYFYRTNKDLSVDRKNFLEDIKGSNPSVILVHGYFGFDTLNQLKDITEEIKKMGITIIEDITQTMYSEFQYIPADYYICSFRKWMALPDGGCAISTKDLFTYKPIKTDTRLEELKLDAFHAKYLYIKKDIGEKNNFLEMFHKAEKVLGEQNSIYAMSGTSKTLLANLDIGQLKEKRRRNFSILSEGLSNNKIVKQIFVGLPEEVIPLYFPIYIRCNRTNFQGYLAKNDIYAPIIWPKPVSCKGSIDLQANWIYEHILSIPCDQRYGVKDMERIVETIKAYEDKAIEEEKGGILK